MPGPVFALDSLTYIADLNTLSNAVLTSQGKSADYTAVRGYRYIHSVNDLDVTMMLAPAAGDQFQVHTYTSTVFFFTLLRNTHNINGQAFDLPVQLSRGDIVSVLYVDATEGYRVCVTRPAAERNAIIGGDFSTNPWQRGTSFVSPANGAVTADMWKHINVTAALVTVSKSADAPTVAQAGRLITHCLLVDCTTADAAVGAGDQIAMWHVVEGYSWLPLAQRPCAIAFWHKHTKTGTHCVGVRNSGADRSLVMEYTQAVTDVWEESLLLLPASPAAGTWNYTNGIGVYLDFTLMAGTNLHTTAGVWQTGSFTATVNQVNNVDNVANNFRIADVRLVVGSTGVAEAREKQEELALCRRYLPAFVGSAGIIANGHAYSATLGLVDYFFEVEPRVAPTGVTAAAAANFKVWDGAGAFINCSAAPAFYIASARGVTLTTTVAAGQTIGRGMALHGISSASTLFFTGCEL